MTNYKAIKIGYINGEGCGIDDGIFIYRLSGDKKKLIRRLPLDIIGDYKDYKWGFLKQYWTKNYPRFLKHDLAAANKVFMQWWLMCMLPA
ncbi:hypothetical protein GCM10023229_37640 [Flavisolibacter ginsenosidimutans]